MKSDISALSTTVISHSSSIKFLKENMVQLASLVYSSPNEDLVAHVNENPMNSIQVSNIVTRSRKILKEIKRPDNVVAKKMVADNEPPKGKGQT
ncbi:hypothetical protein KY290_017258 [Solanum tuberosum]|uniref:Uncharacterized protein n=1 Tax=Solanum tuberosum TaxID=4113 RepID=A0ABQ7VDQ0_SOLTU|nr:hypothetical protein KY284_016285 [Solanum tuberosum]KAH0702015.1 hypothetical protein KY285_016293 [Solanum tuberosum]KAH0761185.1 hypothetical protein KY290_017258 [Solanum tuberosum]